ncbi:MAG TPA: PQQ-binding-like beta-propeller repeat protein [Verrucomicrobiae bacterium]|nr:PQQ-binding-like beta-propeller repeat protein [Verrucomicrobiae bacterium]
MRAAVLKPGFWIPAAAVTLGCAVFGLWLWSGPGRPLTPRVPGTDQAPGTGNGSRANPVLAGKLVRAEGKPGEFTGSWPQFRGASHDGIATAQDLARSWSGSGPRQIWAADLGDGYAGAAVFNGRVYVMDYDVAHKQDALRCLSAANGAEIWRYTYPVSVKRNHGMSRTVPTVTEHYVVAMGPKCHVVCVDSTSGELRWGLDLVNQFGATVPQWYAGQCPLVESNVVVLAPGGPKALLMGVKAETGEVLWQTPNPRGWKMTHSSVMPGEIDGQKMYVYCANNGVVGVAASDGALLWDTTAWKISIATVPSPLLLPGGRIFLSGGYNAGSLMLQLRKNQDRWEVQTLFKLDPQVFGATQHTPIFYQDHIYGVRADGRFACIDLEGKTVWVSDPGQQFGLGSFLMSDGLIFAMNDSGLLRLIQASPEKYRLLAQTQALTGHESWAPLALADGRLYARDLTRMVCLDVAGR